MSISDLNEKIRNFFKYHVGYLAVVLVCLAYISVSFIFIGRTGKTVGQIVADGALAFFFGISINYIFDLQGMQNGEREDCVVNARTEHDAAVLRVSSMADKIDEWCDEQNRKNYEIQRRKILARHGLKYSECFDDDGVIKDWHPDQAKLKSRVLRRIELKKARGFYKAANLQLTELSSGELMSEGGRDQDPFWLGRTKAQYEAERSKGELFSKLVSSLIFGYYGVQLLENFSLANLIWRVLQVALFLIMGVISMYQSYDFVTEEFRGRILKKVSILSRFEAHIKSEDTERAKLDSEAEKTEKAKEEGEA